MKRCRECGQVLEDSAKYCSACGKKCEKTKKHSRFIVIIMAVFLIAIALVVGRWYLQMGADRVEPVLVETPGIEEESVEQDYTVYQWDDLTIQMGQTQMIVTLYGVSLQNEYQVNRVGSNENASEYYWGVTFRGVTDYMIHTASPGSDPGKGGTITLEEMHTAFLRETESENHFEGVEGTSTTVAQSGNSITWTCIMPNGIPFDLQKTIIEVNVSENEYTSNKHTISSAEITKSGQIIEPSPKPMEEMTTYIWDDLTIQIGQTQMFITLDYSNVEDSWNIPSGHSQYSNDYNCRMYLGGEYLLELIGDANASGNIIGSEQPKVKNTLFETIGINHYRELQTAYSLDYEYNANSITWVCYFPAGIPDDLQNMTVIEMDIGGKYFDKHFTQTYPLESATVTGLRQEDRTTFVQSEAEDEVLIYNWDDLEVQIGKSILIVTVTNVDVKDKYEIYWDSSNKEHQGYYWGVIFDQGSDSLSVGIDCYNYEPGDKKYITIDEMDAEFSGIRAHDIKTSISYTNDSITWMCYSPSGKIPISTKDLTRIRFTSYGFRNYLERTYSLSSAQVSEQKVELSELLSSP